MEKGELRPLYSEFQGYLAQAPTIKETRDSINDESMWMQYNEAVDLLSKITGDDYSRFHIEPEGGHGDYRFIRIATYRQKLGGLISALHGKYFADEPPPFSGMPSTIITQSQQQAQSIHVQMLLEIQSKIDEKIPLYSEGSKEKSFLKKFKDSLGSISSVTQLFSQFFKMAKDFGLNIDDVLKIFS